MNRCHVHGKQIELPGLQVKTIKWVGLLMCVLRMNIFKRQSIIHNSQISNESNSH